MSTDLIEKDKAMDTPIDRAASGIVLNKDGIKDIEATWTRQSQVGQSAPLRSSCLSEALQREPGTKQMVDRKIVRQQMLDELDDRTKKDILTDKHSGKPRVVEGDQDALKRLSIPNTIVTTTCEMLKNLPAYHDLNFLAANLLKLLFSLGKKGIPDIVLQRGCKPVKRRDKKGGEVLPPSSFDATVEEIFDEIRLDSSISVLKECLDDFSSVWPNGSSRAWSLSDLTEDWLRESAWDKEVWQRWEIKVICHTLHEEEYDLEPL
ncbi:hypothetical protein LTR46_011376, partial [Exophiala xenobiotica]